MASPTSSGSPSPDFQSNLKFWKTQAEGASQKATPNGSSSDPTAPRMRSASLGRFQKTEPTTDRSLQANHKVTPQPQSPVAKETDAVAQRWSSLLEEENRKLSDYYGGSSPKGDEKPLGTSKLSESRAGGQEPELPGTRTLRSMTAPTRMMGKLQKTDYSFMPGSVSRHSMEAKSQVQGKPEDYDFIPTDKALSSYKEVQERKELQKQEVERKKGALKGLINSSRAQQTGFQNRIKDLQAEIQQLQGSALHKSQTRKGILDG